MKAESLRLSEIPPRTVERVRNKASEEGTCQIAAFKELAEVKQGSWRLKRTFQRVEGI